MSAPADGLQQVSVSLSGAGNVGEDVAAGPAGQQRRFADLFAGQAVGRGNQFGRRLVDLGE
ncbi:hypothetical protein GCM10009574_043990 [Streptomyces asiaticus]